MTAVIYARYSSDNQREESIEGQIRECTAYAEKNGFTVVKHYIDRAVSAKTDNRPQFQQMIKDSERGIFDVIIVWKLDRFARNRYDSARYKTQLKRNGVKLVSATEVISAGPEGIILESVLEGYAEYYSADLSEKVVRGMTENALKGIYNGGTIPFGYMIDETRHYQPDPLLAPYVEQTFQKYADGATMTDLRDWLKAHNIKNSMGGEMSYNTIQRMLSNRRYIGELRLRDVVQPNAIPALVSEDLFNKVQEKLAKNKKAPARHKAEESYLLTTKLYCGKCGALMFGESGVSHTGKMYTYYKCAAAKKKKTCDKKAVRKQWLEDLVVNETMKLVEDDASMNAIIAKVMELQNQESTDLPIYEKQLKETEVGITNMLNAIQMGILTSSTKERLEALEEQRKELQARIAEERLAKPKMKEEFVRFWLLRFRKLDMTQPEQRQALVDTFINAIYLYDDKVLITFNYKEGTETIAFGEAVKAEKSSDMSARGAPNFERQVVRFDVLFLCRKAAAHFLHTVCTLDFLQGRKADTAKLTKNKAKHCDTLQNTKLPDEKAAALFRLKETAKNAILLLTEAKVLSEKIAKRLFCTPRDGFRFTVGSAPPGRRAYRYGSWSGGAWCPRGCGWRRRCTGYPSRSAGKGGRTWRRCGTGSRWRPHTAHGRPAAPPRRGSNESPRSPVRRPPSFL
ncbi:recombinase family protein [Faecalibacterium prausnitzii]|uniref:recombinase family protein n=1 Tax=Faecalibacterium prausnitzii TaxID=853 RepID=UPI003DA15F11